MSEEVFDQQDWLRIMLEVLCEADSESSFPEPLKDRELNFCERMLTKFEGGGVLTKKQIGLIEHYWKRLTEPTKKQLAKKRVQHKQEPSPVRLAETQG